VIVVTRRADLKEEREQALERFGLGADAFRVAEYKNSVALDDLSDEQMSEAVEMARLGAFERAIARVLGVHENVFMEALTRGRKNPESKWGEFAGRFYEARKQHMKKNLAAINAATEEGDWKPAAWQLERSFGFGKFEQVEHNVAPEAFSLMQLAQVPLDEARRVIEAEAVDIDDDLPPAA
jgi:hypothetical protein